MFGAIDRVKPAGSKLYMSTFVIGEGLEMTRPETEPVKLDVLVLYDPAVAPAGTLTCALIVQEAPGAMVAPLRERAVSPDESAAVPPQVLDRAE